MCTLTFEDSFDIHIFIKSCKFQPMTFYQLIEHHSLFNYNEEQFPDARENGTLTYALSHLRYMVHVSYLFAAYK